MHAYMFCVKERSRMGYGPTFVESDSHTAGVIFSCIAAANDSPREHVRFGPEVPEGPNAREPKTGSSRRVSPSMRWSYVPYNNDSRFRGEGTRKGVDLVWGSLMQP